MVESGPENAGMENVGLKNAQPNRMGGNAGLENTGTACVWVARRINDSTREEA